MNAQTARKRFIGASAAVAAVACAITGAMLAPAPYAEAGMPANYWQADSDKEVGHEPYDAQDNPEYWGDFADPDVYVDKASKTYYAFSTSNLGSHVPVVTSKDTRHWQDALGLNPPTDPATGKEAIKEIRAIRDGWGPYIADHYADSLIRQPAWTSARLEEGGGIWAPAVEKLKNGSYIMAYAAQHRAPGGNTPYGQYCLGIAVATPALAEGTGRDFGPWGPYANISKKPFMCGDSAQTPAGLLDPDLFRDPKTGNLYLIYKTEGNSKLGYPAGATTFYSQKLKENGNSVSLDGSPHKLSYTLMDPFRDGSNFKQTWEETVNENPSMVYFKGHYYLFYSADQFRRNSYKTGYTICESAVGPCQRVTHEPFLKTDETFNQAGPGGASAFIDLDGNLRLMYHAYSLKQRQAEGQPAPSDFQQPSHPRFMQVAKLQVVDATGRLAIVERTHRLPGHKDFEVPAMPEITFKDVPRGAQWSEEVMWFKDRGITTGWPDGTFRPVNPVSREAMAAFLYRAAGKPSYTPPKDPTTCFRDNNPKWVPFTKEICWMKETGLSLGWPDKTYRPKENITREAIAAFMYRLAGKPAVAASTNFVDLGRTGFKKEIKWMGQSGLSGGWKNADGTAQYRPSVNLERVAMAVFLKKYLEKYPIVFTHRPGDRSMQEIVRK